MRNLVFIHVHRTGGSSLWHNLVPLGAQVGLGICDIYHHSKLVNGIPIGAKEVLTALHAHVGDAACLYHHHTTEPIRGCFDEGQTLYTTVLRDPVDRFVSLVHHMSHFFRASDIPADYSAYYAELCGDAFCQCVAKSDPQIEELFEAAALRPFFANYYVNLFHAMCQTNTQHDVPASLSANELRNLAEESRRMFAVIGWFSELELAFSRIVQKFGIGDGSARMSITINRSERRDPLLPFVRRRLERMLEAEYAFLEQLGLANKTGVSKIA